MAYSFSDECRLCPRCQYDLRAHVEDPIRCPECGRISNRAELITAEARRRRDRERIGLLADIGGALLFFGGVFSLIGLSIGTVACVAVSMLPWMAINVEILRFARVAHFGYVALLLRQAMLAFALACLGLVGIVVLGAILGTIELARLTPFKGPTATFLWFCVCAFVALWLASGLFRAAAWFSHVSTRFGRSVS